MAQVFSIILKSPFFPVAILLDFKMQHVNLSLIFQIRRSSFNFLNFDISESNPPLYPLNF